VLPAKANNVKSSACTIPIEDIVYLSTGVSLELSLRPLTAVEPDFRQDQLAEESPLAHGVKCHVSYDMACLEMQWAIGLFNKKRTFCSDCEEKPAIRVS
jgi:hypothetical protein